MVEDEPLLAFEYQDELESKGASAIVAMTLAEGLSAMSEQHVDLAILDLNIGRDLSWSLAQNLTAQGVPFFIVSGRCSPSDVPDSVKPIECIDKPIVARRLIGRLEEILGEAVV